MPYRKAANMSVSTRTEELSPEELDDAIREWVENHKGVRLGEIPPGTETFLTGLDSAEEMCGAEISWDISTQVAKGED